MKKLAAPDITEADLQEYLESSSDFAFEISVLRELESRALKVDHAGHYSDPVTGKSREFDFRVRRDVDRFRLALAIEAKNLSKNFPLLLTCLPRPREESWVSIMKVQSEQPDGPFNISIGNRCLNSFKVGPNRLYPEQEPTGRSIAQVGRDAKDSGITAASTEIYEKWGQAIASLHEMVAEFEDLNDEEDSYDGSWGIALPIVVVPDGTLWRAVLHEDGSPSYKIEEVDRVSHFCAMSIKDPQLARGFARPDYEVSHVEFVTMTGLRVFLSSWIEGDGIKKLLRDN
ncbi:MAG: hypothetical protein RLO80_10100 [Hyphomonas sp.]